MKRGGMLRRRALSRVAPGRSASRALARNAIRAAVHERDGGRCVLCDEHVTVVDFECHHRKLRSRGGQDVHSNLVTLCGRCHHDRVHKYPVWATVVGLMVPGWAEPTGWPVLKRHDFRLWAVPDDDSAEWVLTAPHPDQHDEPGPWEQAA